METTARLNLKKPEGLDNAYVSDLNDNMDDLDEIIPIVVYTSSKNTPPEDPVEGTIWLCPAGE